MLTYLQGIWDCRNFWVSLAKLDICKRYRRSALGVGWSVVQPAFMALILSGVFSAALNISFENQFAYVLTGLCFWNYMNSIVHNGCGCLFWSETYIRQHRTPMAIYPIRVVLVSGFQFLAAVSPVIILSWIFRGTFHPTALFFLLVALTFLLLFGWALATICAFLNVYIPDTHQACEVGLQVLFYCTPVLFPAEALRQRKLDWLVDCNPLAAFVEIVREPVVSGRSAFDEFVDDGQCRDCRVDVYCGSHVETVRATNYIPPLTLNVG